MTRKQWDKDVESFLMAPMDKERFEEVVRLTRQLRESGEFPALATTLK